MTQIVLTVVATALLSSLLTLGIAHLVFRKHLKDRLDAELGKAIERFKEEVGPEMEARVKKGVMEGIKSIPSKELLRDTTRSIAKTGLDIMGDSFKMATRPRGSSGRSKRPDYPLEDED